MIMADSAAEMARLMKVTEAIVRELDRQGVADALADLGFDPMQMGRVVIRAADGDVVPFPGPRGPG
jgi:sulfur carrier protein ThiS